MPANNSSLAPSLDNLRHFEADKTVETEKPLRPQIVPPPATPAERPPRQPAYQASLFGPQEVVRVREIPARGPARSAAVAPRVKRDLPAQQPLEFGEPGCALQSSAQASIFCKAVVAPAPLRVASVLFDFLYPGIAAALFWITLRFAGFDVALAQTPIWLFGVVPAVSVFLYRVLYCLGNSDTPGVRWAGLKLIDFDGRTPTREQRLKRFLAGLVSIVALGLGVVWALFEEERLSWHDSMSKTFATIADDGMFARR